MPEKCHAVSSAISYNFTRLAQIVMNAVSYRSPAKLHGGVSEGVGRHRNCAVIYFPGGHLVLGWTVNPVRNMKICLPGDAHSFYFDNRNAGSCAGLSTVCHDS